MRMIAGTRTYESDVYLELAGSGKLTAFGIGERKRRFSRLITHAQPHDAGAYGEAVSVRLSLLLVAARLLVIDAANGAALMSGEDAVRVRVTKRGVTVAFPSGLTIASRPTWFVAGPAVTQRIEISQSICTDAAQAAWVRVLPTRLPFKKDMSWRSRMYLGDDGQPRVLTAEEWPAAGCDGTVVAFEHLRAACAQVDRRKLAAASFTSQVGRLPMLALRPVPRRPACAWRDAMVVLVGIPTPKAARDRQAARRAA